jgi:hypothetical protein
VYVSGDKNTIEENEILRDLGVQMNNQAKDLAEIWLDSLLTTNKFVYHCQSFLVSIGPSCFYMFVIKGCFIIVVV